jgi:hypothetical protein
MTKIDHTEAESAAAETRALWQEYREVNREIGWRASSLHIGGLPPSADAESVGRVVRLLREQKRILNELIPNREDLTT